MNQTRNGGGEAVIVGATPRIKSLFTVTKLDSVFTMKEKKADAIAHFNQMSQNK
jgi:anti-anti-sigma regulatory factor